MIANILIAVGVYFFGWSIANFLSGGIGNKTSWEGWLVFILYTILWVGICWKYIF